MSLWPAARGRNRFTSKRTPRISARDGSLADPFRSSRRITSCEPIRLSTPVSCSRHLNRCKFGRCQLSIEGLIAAFPASHRTFFPVCFGTIKWHQGRSVLPRRREANSFPRPNKFFIVMGRRIGFRRNLNSSLSGVECQNSAGAKHRFRTTTKLNARSRLQYRYRSRGLRPSYNLL